MSSYARVLVSRETVSWISTGTLAGLHRACFEKDVLNKRMFTGLLAAGGYGDVPANNVVRSAQMQQKAINRLIHRRALRQSRKNSTAVTMPMESRAERVSR